MESQIKAIYITKKESVGHGDVISYNNKNVIYFQYHEFIDLYLSKDINFRRYIDSVVESFNEKVPNCEIIFLQPSDDYIIKKFNEYLIDRLMGTDIECRYIEPVWFCDFKQIKDGKFVNE
jgi:hypothetical protein